MAGGGEGKTLEETPTYATASVIFFFVAISVITERLIDHLSKVLKKRKQKPLSDALDRMRNELMLLGFISFLLTVCQNYISQICVPEYGRSLMPCNKRETGAPEGNSTAPAETHRRLRRVLLGEIESTFKCPKGKEPFISVESLHQLHILLFILAIMHILLSCITMVLAIYRIQRWKKWETEAQELMEQCKKKSKEEQRQVMLTKRSTTFVRRHSRTVVHRNLLMGRVVAFFRQFCSSVTRDDYLTLRLAFIHKHMNKEVKFDFHQYLIRCMEDDFKVVVGISWWHWAFLCIWLLLTVSKWQVYFWFSIAALVVISVVGTKLVWIVMTLAHEAMDVPDEESQKPHVAMDMKLRNELFWFNHPELILHIVHFILYQNAFEITSFVFYAWQYGIHSCIFGHWSLLVARVVISCFIQALCSYVTLPLYALVSQMGDHYKASIFSNQVVGTVRLLFKSKKKRSSIAGQVAGHVSVVGQTVGGGVEVVKDAVVGSLSATHHAASTAADHALTALKSAHHTALHTLGVPHDSHPTSTSSAFSSDSDRRDSSRSGTDSQSGPDSSATARSPGRGGEDGGGSLSPRRRVVGGSGGGGARGGGGSSPGSCRC